MMTYTNEKINRETNGYFERTITWNVLAIAEKEHANGYIVQRINRKTEACKSFWSTQDNKEPFFHEYWEAWLVKDGKIEFTEKYDTEYDDIWSYKSKVPSFDAKMKDYAEKLYTKGTIKMQGDVFWVDINDAKATILEKTFKKKAVPYAGELLSSWTFAEMEGENPKQSVFFSSSWDFLTKEKFFEAVWMIYRELDTSLEKLEEDIDSFFSSLDVYNELKGYLIEKKGVCPCPA